jgi:hypothetical protein
MALAPFLVHPKIGSRRRFYTPSLAFKLAFAPSSTAAGAGAFDTPYFNLKARLGVLPAASLGMIAALTLGVYGDEDHRNR